MSGWLLFATVLGAIIIVSRLLIRRECHALVGVFERLVPVFGGTVTPGNLLYYPRLNFEHRGVAMVAGAMPTTARQTFTAGGPVHAGGSSARSYVDFPLPRPGESAEVEVRPATLKAKADKALARNRLRSGDAAFDRAFLIHGTPADRVSLLLDEGLRARLLADADRGMTMRVRRGRCTVSMPGLGMEEGAYECLIGIAVALCDRLLELDPGRHSRSGTGGGPGTGTGLHRSRLEFDISMPGPRPLWAANASGIGRENGG